LENGIIINDPSFLPFFPIFQNILCPGLGAAKLESLLLKTVWIKVLPIFYLMGKGGSFQDPGSLIPHLKKEAREN
jgi:hypothetical protein